MKTFEYLIKKEKVIIETFEVQRHGDIRIWTTNELLEYMEGFAKAACKEQREICASLIMHPGLEDNQRLHIKNAPQPELK